MEICHQQHKSPVSVSALAFDEDEEAVLGLAIGEDEGEGINEDEGSSDEEMGSSEAPVLDFPWSNASTQVLPSQQVEPECPSEDESEVTSGG